LTLLSCPLCELQLILLSCPLCELRGPHTPHMTWLRWRDVYAHEENCLRSLREPTRLPTRRIGERFGRVQYQYDRSASFVCSAVQCSSAYSVDILPSAKPKRKTVHKTLIQFAALHPPHLSIPPRPGAPPPAKSHFPLLASTAPKQQLECLNMFIGFAGFYVAFL